MIWSAMRARIFKGAAWAISAVAIGLTACSTPSAPEGDTQAGQADESMPPPGIPRKYVAPHEFNGDELGISLSELKSRHPRLTNHLSTGTAATAQAAGCAIPPGFLRLPPKQTAARPPWPIPSPLAAWWGTVTLDCLDRKSTV